MKNESFSERENVSRTPILSNRKPINLLQISNFITFCEIIIIFVNAVIYMYLSCWWWWSKHLTSTCQSHTVPPYFLQIDILQKRFIFIIRWTFVCVIVMDNHQKHNIETRATAKWLVYHVPCSTPGSEESNSRCRFSVRGREIGCCIIIYTIGNVYVTKGSRHGILVNQCLLPSFIQFLFFVFDNFSFHGWFLLITVRTASVM